jgi:MFS family permease
MQRTLMRALLLATSLLLLAAYPVAAQSEGEGWLLSSETNSVIIAAEQDVEIGPTETTEGLVVFDGTALIEGSVDSILAVQTDVTITGANASVERVFTISGSLTLADGATVGDVYYTDTDVSNDGTVTVTGEMGDVRDELAGALGAIVAVLIVLIIFVVIGVIIASLAMTLLVIAFGTDQTRRAAATISQDVFKVVVVGLLMLIVPSALFWLLAITVVGLPLAIILLLFWGFVAFLGQVVVAVWIGERILPRGRTAARPYGSAFLGMVILLLLWWTGIVPLLVGIFGTGAVTLAGWRMLRTGGTPPMPPAYGQPWGQPMPVMPPPYAPPPYAPPPAPPAPQAPPDQWPPQGGQPPDQWPPQGGQPPDQWPPQGGQPPASWPQG